MERDDLFMQKIFCFFLASSRKCRSRMVNIILWLLRLLREVEKCELWRNSKTLESFSSKWISHHEYDAVEEECIYCESAFFILESVIENLECAY